jgi:RNase H-fold protein (predicted Holliday junction resolvase)
MANGMGSSSSLGSGKRGAVKGSTWKAHKYIARVPLGNNTFRYFYTPQEIQAYKTERRKVLSKWGKVESLEDEKETTNKTAKKNTKKKETKKKKSGGHFKVASTGRILTGYRAGGEKPKGVSDEYWDLLQKAWGFKKADGSPVARVKRKKSKSKENTKKKAQKVLQKKIKKTVDHQAINRILQRSLAAKMKGGGKK